MSYVNGQSVIYKLNDKHFNYKNVDLTDIKFKYPHHLKLSNF